MAVHISKVVKGLIIALAPVAVLDRDPDPATTVLAIAGALAAIILDQDRQPAPHGDVIKTVE